MKILIVIISFLAFSLSYSKNYRAEVVKFYINEKLIINATSRIKFTAESEIFINESNPNNFYHFELENKNGFINFSDVEVIPSNCIRAGNNFYFKSSSNGSPLNRIKFTIKGTAVFNWLSKEKIMNNVKIGYINSNANPVFFDLKLEQFQPVQKLKIKVNKDMNLGRTPAGEKLSTKPGGTGTPADISISGQIGKDVLISIPQWTEIKNSKNNSMKVNLEFRENRSSVLRKTLIPNNSDIKKEGENGTAVINRILIDGECQTNKNNFGKYQGSFTVRVEYED